MRKETVASLESIIEDNKKMLKYCTKVIYAQIGSVEIISHKTIKSFDEAKADTNLANPIPHIRKIMTTDSRVGTIEDLREYLDTDKRLSVLHSIVRGDAISLDDKKTDKNASRLTLHLVRPFRLKLKLQPDEKQKPKWEEMYSYRADVSEECWAWWDGETFLAYTTDSEEANRHFGHKARDVMQSLFKDSEVFDGANIGPTPIHPDFNVLMMSKERLAQDLTKTQIHRLVKQVVMIDYDIFIPILVDSEDKASRSVHQAAKELYVRLRPIIHSFYRAKTCQRVLIRKEERFSGMFKKLIDEFLTLQEVPVYKLCTRRRLSKSLDKLDSQIHLILTEEYETRSFLDEDIAYMNYSFRADNLYNTLENYFLQSARSPETIDRASVLSALARLDQELNRYSTFNVQLISAVVGAIIAVALMYAGAYLNSLFGT